MNDQEKLEKFVQTPGSKERDGVSTEGSYVFSGLIAIARAIVIAACVLKGRDIPWEGR